MQPFSELARGLALPTGVTPDSDEDEARDARRRENRRLIIDGFPPKAVTAAFDVADPRCATEYRRTEGWRRGFRAGAGLGIHGAKGVGKTCLAVLLARWVYRAFPWREVDERTVAPGAEVAFIEVPTLCRLLVQAERKDHDAAGRCESLLRPDLLVLDDLGLGTSLPDWRRELFAEWMLRRYERRGGLVYTTLRQDAELVELYGEAVMDRIWDRTRGEFYRLAWSHGDSCRRRPA